MNSFGAFLLQFFLTIQQNPSWLTDKLFKTINFAKNPLDITPPLYNLTIFLNHNSNESGKLPN